MKLEVVDKRNPRLIRVATIIAVDDQRLKVHILDYYIITLAFPLMCPGMQTTEALLS